MINSLSVQLEKQAEILKHRQSLESQISKYINQEEIFDKIKNSLQYRLQVDEITTNKYITALKLNSDYDNTYLFYIAEDKGYIISEYKYLATAHIKLNNSKTKLIFRFETFEKEKEELEIKEIIMLLNLLIGI